MAAARAGDERAFRTLVEPYERALEVHCYRMLGSLHDAQDVTQETLEPLIDASADPAARFALREGMELALLTAIQRLPGRQRAVLLLRDVLGWTGTEVADLLDTTVASANSALQRARATVDELVPTRSPTAGGPADRELLRRYLEAWDREDATALTALLRDDAVLSMPPQPAVTGAAEIVSFFTAVRAPDGVRVERIDVVADARVLAAFDV